MKKNVDSETLVVETYRLKPAQVNALAKLKVRTIRDLLYHFPSRYEIPRAARKIAELTAGAEVAVYGIVRATKMTKAFRKKIPLAEMVIEDDTGRLKAIWFHQAYIAKQVAVGQAVKLSGKVAERRGELYLSNPLIESAAEGAMNEGSLFHARENTNITAPDNHLLPIYPESRGISSAWFAYRLRELLTLGVNQTLSDPLPEMISKRYHLPSLPDALVLIHSPKSERDATAARKRFAFEEVFLIQLARQQIRAAYQTHTGYRITTDPARAAEFLASLPFTPTKAQVRAVEEIRRDFERGQPMMRLLEGDVGSGKTAVAAATADQIVAAGLNVAYMAPTEILARQHFASFIRYCRRPGLAVGLLTGSECRKFPSKVDPTTHTHISRSQLLKWVANGEIPIVVGTQALIQKSVTFKKLAYVIIDEQHRFGVEQRARLVGKHDRLPHLLSMTATPIPRTLALTIHGDLDLTLLDELPAGRGSVQTTIVRNQAERTLAYKRAREEIRAGRQVYVICPRIDEPDPLKELALEATSAKKEAQRLAKDVFPEFTVGLIHSKLKLATKEKVMAEFAEGLIQVLVATSVVEVGVDVPKATVMIIEGAERFGLAQLHQLRGRVRRSKDQAYCFVITDQKSGKALKRLQALIAAKNGFELAELDLKLRGAGSLAGAKQWGLTDLGMEAMQNLKMVEAARFEAKNFLAQNPNFTLPTRQIHFE